MSTPAAVVRARARNPRPAEGRARTRSSLRVAPEVARRRLRARLLVWSAVLVTVASAFMLVAFHVLAVQSAFSLDHLAKERTNEQLRYERLREQVATSSSAETVIAAARRLGMVPGDAVVTLTVPDVPTTPTATPTSVVPDPAPAALSPQSYDTTKRHLGP